MDDETWNALAFANWLRDRMREREWNQADLARRVGLPAGTINRWLTGERRPSSRSCDLLADALRVDLDAVLALAGHRPDVDEPPAGDPRRDLLALLRRVDLDEERTATLRVLLEAFAGRPLRPGSGRGRPAPAPAPAGGGRPGTPTGPRTAR